MKNELNYEYKLTQKVILFQLLYHCELMYDYLTETGKEVPENISKDLSSISLEVKSILKEYNSKKKVGEINADIEFDYHTKIAEKISGEKGKLAKIFNELTLLIKPASPCTLENTIPTQKIFGWWGHKCIPFIRGLWWISFFFLVGYVIIGILNGSEFGLLINKNNIYSQLLLFFSGGLGACLYALNTSKSYILNRTFDDKYITHYYNRIVIGVITGFILANIINASIFNASDTDTLARITPSLLALLGGFSADAVIRILNRLVAMITTLVEGETKDIIESREEVIKNRFEAEKIRQNMNYIIELKSKLDASGLDKNKNEYKNIEDVIDKIMLSKT